MYNTKINIIIIFEILRTTKNKFREFFFTISLKLLAGFRLNTIYSQLFILKDKFGILKDNFYMFLLQKDTIILQKTIFCFTPIWIKMF